MYSARASKACFCKRRDGYKKTQGARWRSVSFFPTVARAPAAAEWGMHSTQCEQNPLAEWGMPEAKSPERGNAQPAGRANHSLSPSQWRSKTPPQHPPAHIICTTRRETLRVAQPTLSTGAYSLHSLRNCLGANFSRKDKKQAPNPIPGRRGLPDLT